MSSHSGPNVANRGLVFSFDMANGKSNVGAPVINTIPNPAINGLPTFGNSWGTFNVNQYNNNQYFSIGTIASVSNNIVVTTSAHPLRSYDVVTPQTAGGGLSTIGYLVKKISNTSFSLHLHNGSQDGSQGFINPATGTHKVYDNFALDIRIPVNSSGFPTMWWGFPHIPNSALVKEIIPNGFDAFAGKANTDCIRLHYIRTDGVTDGMSYGADAAVTAGNIWTASFWIRAVSISAVGMQVNYQIHNYGSTAPSGHSRSCILGELGVWQKYSLQFTPNNPLAISYWFPTKGLVKYEIANIQFEIGSIANNFTAGVRSTTEAIIDSVGNNVITVNGLSYSNDGNFNFNGSGNSISIPSIDFSNEQTIEIWLLPEENDGVRRNPYNQAYGGYGTWTHEPNGTINYYYGDAGSNTQPYIGHTSNFTVAQNEIACVCTTRNTTQSVWYKNGVRFNSFNHSYSTLTTDLNSIIIGTGYAGSYLGKIFAVKLYNRSLSPNEVQENFQSTRSRYGV